MKGVGFVVGLAAAAAAAAEDTTLDFEPEDWPVPSPPIANCAEDYRERGRATEMPVYPADVGHVRAMLDHDIRSIEPEGLSAFRALEPVCFYLLQDGRILMRDGRGIEYYFQKVPRWEPDRIDFPAQRADKK
jgi:hypothetical protein